MQEQCVNNFIYNDFKSDNFNYDKSNNESCEVQTNFCSSVLSRHESEWCVEVKPCENGTEQTVLGISHSKKDENDLCNYDR